MIQEVTRPNSIKLRYENGAQFPELLIANYDMNERMRATSQIALF
jgi:DNA adenine methylase